MCAGLRAWWGIQQKTAWTGGVLAGALACCLLQRHKPEEQGVNICLKPDDMKGKTFSSFRYLAEQISDGWSWQYSLVHSGRQLSGSKDSITAQTQMVNKHWNKSTKKQHKTKISNLVLRLISYQWQCQLFLTWADKTYNYGLTVSGNLWIKGSLDHTISFHIYHTATIFTLHNDPQWTDVTQVHRLEVSLLWNVAVFSIHLHNI